MWREAVDLAPSNLCVVDREQRLNYAEADELVRRVASGQLRAHAVGQQREPRGDVLGTGAAHGAIDAHPV